MQILTLNTWGAPYAKERAARFHAIGKQLQHIQPDVIALQEVFLPGQRDLLHKYLHETWPYHRYFPSGIIGSGLMTFSRYPIVYSEFHRFRLNGKPEDVFRGDFYAGKGIGLTRLQTPYGIINVYNTHTHAQYQPDHDNEFAAYNETNLYEVVKFIQQSSQQYPVVLCGDLNTRPDQMGYEIVSHIGMLDDAYVQKNGTHPITYSIQNPYAQSADQCLDYVFHWGMRVESIDLVLTESPLRECKAYSDHYGLLATMTPATEIPSLSDKIAFVQTLHKLLRRVEFELVEVEGQQMGRFERGAIAIGSLLDIGMLVRPLLRRFAPHHTRTVSRILASVALTYGILQWLEATTSLQARKSTLQSIREELTSQIDSQSLFDGRTW